VPHHLGCAGPLIEQFHQLAIQLIDSFSQFFQRHFILVVRLRPGRGDSIKNRVGVQSLAFAFHLSLANQERGGSMWQRNG
jgi:hypothetical protein